MSDARQGGNYTRPIPYSKPILYEALIGGEVVGVYDSHQAAEAAVRRAFAEEIVHIDARHDLEAT